MITASIMKGLNVKLWWVGARIRRKRTFFVPFILSEGNFFHICVLSQCLIYWIHFQNIHSFTYQKTLLHTLLLVVFRIVETLQFILNNTVKLLNSGHLRVLKNLSVIEGCPLLGGNFKKIVTFLSAIHGMSAIWDALYWEISLYLLFTLDCSTHSFR